MSDRHKTHNGRDVDGHFKVKQADVDDLLEDPKGPDFVRDDVRLGGAVEDIGAQAGMRAEHVGELIEENRENVKRVAESHAPGRGKPQERRPARRHKGNH
jgi:hypothetical protein